jgi:hypothetical protein
LSLLLAGSNIIRRERTALTLLWIPYLVVGFIIWIGRVGEAVLAINLIVVAMAALGLSFLMRLLEDWRPGFGLAGLILGFLLLLLLIFTGRPDILAVTRDPAASETIEIVDRLGQSGDGKPISFMALEGNDYWQLRYAQEYENRFPDLEIIKHSRNFSAVLDRGDRLMTLSKTLFLWPLETWERLLGPVYLSAAAPGVIEISNQPAIGFGDLPDSLDFDLGNGILIQSYELSWLDRENLQFNITWHFGEPDLVDYNGVHLVQVDPPVGPEDTLSQAD